MPDDVPLGELGWRHDVRKDDPAVQQLREQLEAESGAPRLEDSCVWPHEPDYGNKAAEILKRDGCAARLPHPCPAPHTVATLAHFYCTG